MGVRLGDYDFFGGDPESTTDPYAFLALAREQGPVYKDPRTGVYILLDTTTSLAWRRIRETAASSETTDEKPSAISRS